MLLVYWRSANDVWCTYNLVVVYRGGLELVVGWRLVAALVVVLLVEDCDIVACRLSI